MREIKFRGQRLENKQWIFGHYNKALTPAKYEDMVSVHRINLTGIENYFVIPETVGQYTGYKDKKGVEIYEGDILHEGDGTFWSRYEVVWFKNSCQFSLDCTRVSPNIQYPSWDRASGMTIIGNIHSNPELLK